MKKKIITLLLALCLVFAFAACTDGDGDDNTPTDGNRDVAITDASLKNLAGTKPIFYTCIGQGDYDTGIALLTEAGLAAADYTAGKGITAAQAKENGASLVIIVVAGSSKGLGGSTGFTQAGELTRAQAFVTAADANEITLVVMHIGNVASRGSLSDPFINAIAPGAKLLLVRDNGTSSGGNHDGLFSTIAQENDIPLYMYSKNGDLVAPLKYILGK